MTLTAVQLASITAVAAALIPPVTSFLKQEHWPAWVKQAIAFVASVVAAAVGIAATTTDWSAVNLSALAALAFTGSQVVYQAYFRNSAFETTLTRALSGVLSPPSGATLQSPAPTPSNATAAHTAAPAVVPVAPVLPVTPVAPNG